MIKATDLEALLVAAMPDAVVELEDLTGTEDHWSASIVSGAFDGVSLIKRHRMVYAILSEQMKGPIHALALDTKTPAEAAADVG